MASALHYYHPAWIVPSRELLTVDLAVYGGSAAGIVAALTAARAGLGVVLLHPGQHLGGLTSGGLTNTDIGNKFAIGGMARQFYRDLGTHYGTEEAWRFEPGVAERLLERYLAEARLEVRRGAYLAGVDKRGDRLTELRCEGGLRVRAGMFIDATYEGDLMAAAGVTYTVGREANAQYGETCNGVQLAIHHQFDGKADPYRVPGQPASGLLPQVNAGPVAPAGSGDKLVQAYNFRVCMTTHPGNRLPFARPEGYDAEQYVLIARWLADTRDNVFAKFDLVTQDKTDTNNRGAVSTDFIGANYRWPEGCHAEREAIFQAHVRYQQGLHWYMANDPAVPEPIRTRYATWGLARDEYADTGHWPHQLYIREARRMVSDYVVTENDCMGRRRCADPVGMGAYSMDSHNCQRVIVDGVVKNEGDVQIPLPAPYPISWQSIIPRRAECANLLVPVCVSASHIAYGSVRMEPVFMILAQSAALAAELALSAQSAIQDVPYSALGKRLEAAQQILSCNVDNRGARGNAV